MIVHHKWLLHLSFRTNMERFLISCEYLNSSGDQSVCRDRSSRTISSSYNLGFAAIEFVSPDVRQPRSISRNPFPSGTRLSMRTDRSMTRCQKCHCIKTVPSGESRTFLSSRSKEIPEVFRRIILLCVFVLKRCLVGHNEPLSQTPV